MVSALKELARRLQALGSERRSMRSRKLSKVTPNKVNTREVRHNAQSVPFLIQGGRRTCRVKNRVAGADCAQHDKAGCG